MALLGLDTSLLSLEGIDREGPKHVQLQTDRTEHISLPLGSLLPVLRGHVVSEGCECSNAEPAGSLLLH